MEKFQSLKIIGTLLWSWMGLDLYYARFWDLQTTGDLRSHDSWESNVIEPATKRKNSPIVGRSPGRESLSLGHVLNHSLILKKVAELPEIHIPCFLDAKKKVNIDLTAPPSQPFQPFNSFLFWVEVPKQNSFRFKTKELRKNAGKSSQKCG